MTDSFVGRKVLGRYRIVRSIGRGGMGLIYLARQEGAAAFAKPVVVKRATPDLLAEQPALREFMGREARIMSHLHHPSIVNVIDFAEEDGAYLLVLDYVHGYHLGQWNRFIRSDGRRFPVELAIQVVCKMLDALHYAHTVPGPGGGPLGVVHRDVSPGNVLIDLNGTVKLADFGIARMHSDQTETNNQERLLKGKLSYMAPELLTLSPPTAQTDLYAAAIVLNELLAGKNEMHVSGSLETTAARIFHHMPTPASKVRDDVSKELDAILAKGFAKSPDVRYRDSAEFAQALRAVRGGTEEEVDRRLMAAIDADFKNPRMPEAVAGHDLATLDRAWREAPQISERPPQIEAQAPASPGPTIPAPARDTRGGGSRVAVWLAAGLAAVAAAVAVYALVLRPPAPPPVTAPVIVVGGGEVTGTDGLRFEAGVRSHPGSAVAQTTEPATSAGASSTSAAVPPATVPTAPRAASGGVDGLTRAFARREGQVAACFDANASDLQGAPEIAIRFGVGTDGHVSSAQVLPAAIASTPLGACLAGVARGTQFGAQAQAVSFRIPITARRGQ